MQVQSNDCQPPVCWIYREDDCVFGQMVARFEDGVSVERVAIKSKPEGLALAKLRGAVVMC